MKNHRSHSRGIATVLIMLLMGMALTAVVLGAGHYIRSNQAQTLSAHAQTQSQMKAWTGVEIVRQYLQALEPTKLNTLLAMPMPVALTLTGDGVANLMQASITAVNQVSNTVTVQISGLTATGTRSEARSVLQVVYGVGTTASSGICTAKPKASVIFKGNVNITGGTTSILGDTGYADIAAEGSLTISNASEAIISGCAKGDINLSGGGIDKDATLTAENGKITIQSMSTPSNAGLWGRDISIGNSGNGTYKFVAAGAYAANVSAEGTAVGTANVGGRLLASTAGNTIPWTTGTVIPLNTGNVVIVATDGSQYLLDMTKVTVDASTGTVTGAKAAADRLQGTGTLPDKLLFKSQSVRGGAIDLYTLTIQDLWGHGVDIRGYSGSYTKVRSNGHFKVVTGSIGTFTGGGDFWASEGGCSSPSNCWNFPSVTGSDSRTAGKIQYGGGKTLGAGSLSNLKEQVGTSPGLPGVPFCDTRTETIDASIYRSQANYVFEIVNSVPQLTIQNVMRLNEAKQRVSVDGVYNLKTPTTDQRKVLEELMICDYGNNKGCLQSGTNWTLGGVRRFPSGVVWFDRDVTVSGTEVDLLTTLVTKGSLTLTTSGHKDLRAPNFSTPANICDGTFRPTNLCTVENNVSMFAKWVDSSGKEQRGLPLTNMAVITQQAMSSQGWTIYGNINLGGEFTSGANATQIYGAISVGANQNSPTTITQGGLRVNTQNLDSKAYVPSTQCTPATTPAVSVRWTRYL